jgi:hypothetical protein
MASGVGDARAEHASMRAEGKGGGEAMPRLTEVAKINMVEIKKLEEVSKPTESDNRIL